MAADGGGGGVSTASKTEKSKERIKELGQVLNLAQPLPSFQLPLPHRHPFCPLKDGKLHVFSPLLIAKYSVSARLRISIRWLHFEGGLIFSIRWFGWAFEGFGARGGGGGGLCSGI